MNTKPSTGFSTYKNSIVAVIMLVLSAMVLVVSCLLNKMLKSIHNSQTDTPAKINQNNSIKHSSIQYRNASGCIFAIKNTGIVKSFLPGKRTITGPLFPFNDLNQTSFENNDLVGGVNYNTYNLVTYSSKLPLFLLYHQLLI